MLEAGGTSRGWPACSTAPSCVSGGDPGELLRHLCRLGRAREHSGDLAGALAAFRRAREIDPTSLPALKGLAGILGPRGDGREALPVLEAILASHRAALTTAELAVTSGWAGQILERQGEAARAAESYERALEADPQHVRPCAGWPAPCS